MVEGHCDVVEVFDHSHPWTNPHSNSHVVVVVAGVVCGYLVSHVLLMTHSQDFVLENYHCTAVESYVLEKVEAVVEDGVVYLNPNTVVEVGVFDYYDPNVAVEGEDSGLQNPKKVVGVVGDGDHHDPNAVVGAVGDGDHHAPNAVAAAVDDDCNVPNVGVVVEEDGYLDPNSAVAVEGDGRHDPEVAVAGLVVFSCNNRIHWAVGAVLSACRRNPRMRKVVVVFRNRNSVLDLTRYCVGPKYGLEYYVCCCKVV